MRDPAEIKPALGLEPLPVGVEQGDSRYRHTYKSVASWVRVSKRGSGGVSRMS